MAEVEGVEGESQQGEVHQREDEEDADRGGKEHSALHIVRAYQNKPFYSRGGLRPL